MQLEANIAEMNVIRWMTEQVLIVGKSSMEVQQTFL